MCTTDLYKKCASDLEKVFIRPTKSVHQTYKKDASDQQKVYIWPKKSVHPTLLTPKPENTKAIYNIRICKYFYVKICMLNFLVKNMRIFTYFYVFIIQVVFLGA